MSVTEFHVSDVEEAEARLREAKAAFYADRCTETRSAFNAAKAHVNAVRSGWRRQEEAAGRRGAGFVGGDAQRGS